MGKFACLMQGIKWYHDNDVDTTDSWVVEQNEWEELLF